MSGNERITYHVIKALRMSSLVKNGGHTSSRLSPERSQAFQEARRVSADTVLRALDCHGLDAVGEPSSPHNMDSSRRALWD
jgi:hypothetical protein